MYVVYVACLGYRAGLGFVQDWRIASRHSLEDARKQLYSRSASAIYEIVEYMDGEDVRPIT